MSAGADTKANALGAGGALKLLEHAILFDAARDDDGGRDAEPLAREVDLLGRLRALELVDLKRGTIDTAKGEACRASAGADAKANAFGPQAHLSEVSAAAEGSNLLSTIAPGTPTALYFRLSSVMLFSRKETSGIPQKSVIMACSSTTLAKWSAASPVMLLEQTLSHQGTLQW